MIEPTPFHHLARAVIPATLHTCFAWDWDGTIALTAKATLAQLDQLRGIASRVLADAETGTRPIHPECVARLREMINECDKAIADPRPQSKLAMHALDPSPSALVH